MTDHECCAEQLKGDIADIKTGIAQVHTEARTSWSPAARQTWLNKQDLDRAKGAVRALLVLCSLLTVAVAILGALQVARAFGGV